MRFGKLLGRGGFTAAVVVLGMVVSGCDSAGAPVSEENSIRAKRPTKDGGSGPGAPGATGATEAPGGKGKTQ